MWAMIIRGSAAHLPLADETVQVCITSIPYWGLRAYHGLPAQIWGGAEDCAHEWGKDVIGKAGAGGPSQKQESNAGSWFPAPISGYCIHCNAWRGHYGLEPQLSEYIAHTVEIFREVWRVLKPSGTLWLNVGDAYAGGGRGGNPVESPFHFQDSNLASKGLVGKVPSGLKPKDLIGLPWRVAFALQSDGWYLRSAITLCKRAPMPESVRDRPTQATEMLFLLSKQDSYYYDAEAVKERSSENSHGSPRINPGWKAGELGNAHGATKLGKWTKDDAANGRNLRNWIEITTEPNTWATCGDCHHTTDRWPKCAWCGGATTGERNPSLTDRSLGRSVEKSTLQTQHNRRNPAMFLPPGYDECPRCHGKQICPGCGGTNIIGHFAAFPSRIPELAIKAGTSEKGECAKCGAQVERVIESEHLCQVKRGTVPSSYRALGQPQQAGVSVVTKTVAWRPTCRCDAGTRPNLVLDNFGGSGSTSVVAERLGRRHCMIELSADYIHIARARTRERSLFTAAGVNIS